MNHVEWIKEQIENGKTWDEIKEISEEMFLELRDEYCYIPRNVKYSEWSSIVETRRQAYSEIVRATGLSRFDPNGKQVPNTIASCWKKYKESLTNILSDGDITTLEQSSQWLLNQLTFDSRVRRGLVMGSVQSGKTANMVGLVSMAADYDWNFFIVLSGSIDNLRIQTRNRFMADLKNTDAVTWHMLDYGSGSDTMYDFHSENYITADELKLNAAGASDFSNKYVIICLKQSKRLSNLISWIHTSNNISKKIRLVVIDDEADQASINTKLMDNAVDDDPEDDEERTRINQSIVNLVNNCTTDSAPSDHPLQSINYISYTATPYANILNEKIEGYSLYPSDFIFSLPEPKSYFGAKAIFGSHSKPQEYPGLKIVRTIPPDEYKTIEKMKDGPVTITSELKKSLEWFFCAAAVLRLKNTRPKPISMLIHTSPRVKIHLTEYLVVLNWLNSVKSEDFIRECENVYNEEVAKFGIDDLKKGYPDYQLISQVSELPYFAEIKDDIKLLKSNITRISLTDEGEFEFDETGVHVCVDNSISLKYADQDTYMRVVYPEKDTLSEMKKSPVFIVFGGNTLSRGLTLEGLTCTYFARKVSQADTLMQMARWFGYRKGSELLQRIWLTDDTKDNFKLLQQIDEELKTELNSFVKDNKSPREFGPRIMSIPSVIKLKITAKNRMQGAVEIGGGYSGDAFETTKFKNDYSLIQNLEALDRLIKSIGQAPVKSSHSDSSYVWRNISVETVLEFIKAYKDYDGSNAKVLGKIKDSNENKKYLKWNVCLIGNQYAKHTWQCGEYSDIVIGKSVRSKSSNDPDINIMRLRNGIDALADVDVPSLSVNKLADYIEARDTGHHVFATRGYVGLEDVPALLIYRIDKGAEKTGQGRESIKSIEDIIGYAIIISGDGQAHTGPTYLSVKG